MTRSKSNNISFYNDLNGPQIKAVTSTEGPVLIIAGAGSGKTRVITYRIANMLEKGIKQSEILALTFTNKASREMQQRVKQLTGKKLQSLTVSTFHAFGLKIIKECADILGYRKNFSIYDETDKITLLKESLRECKMFHFTVGNQKDNFYELCQFFSKIKISLSDFSGHPELKPVYDEYNHSLKIYNSLDFDDLLTLPLELFKTRPDILLKYRQKFRYFLVDEFQDTSLIQYKLLKLLTDSQNANICVVGDDDQSIYSWRGANYENIVLFEKDFPGRLEIKLEQNYRSTSTILDAANGVISHNSGRKGKKLWAEKETGKPIKLFFPENETDEALFIASQIKEIMANENLDYRDFAVLTRTNSLARNIEEAFLGENIPYRVSGGTSFFQRKEIKDIICYLRVIANTDDDVSLMRVINTPRRGIGKTTISALGDIAKKNSISIWDSLVRLNYSKNSGQQALFSEGKHPSKEITVQEKTQAADIEEFETLIEKHKSLFLERKGEKNKPWKLSQCLRVLVDDIDYWSYLVMEHGKDEKKARWKYSNIEYFIRMIENWESDPDNLDCGLYPWLNRISLITRDDAEEDSENKANLMTIHASKGLEFPVVFIAGAEKGLIPHEKSVIDSENEEGTSVEEERRLFYVAITRAQQLLYITSCKKRRRLQSANDCEKSPFLDEIPEGLIEIHADEKGKQAQSADEEQAQKYIDKMKALFG